MKRKKLFPTLIILMLALSMLLSACRVASDDTQEAIGTFFAATTEAPTETREPTETQEPTETEPATEYPSYTPYEEYERPEEGILEECSFDEIVYERPDAQGIIDEFADLQTLVEDGASCDEILAAYLQLDDKTTIFSTMDGYAYIRYCLDLNDSYYEDEYNWCEEQLPLVAQAEEKCFIAMGKSTERSALEAEFFGEGFFEFYDENQIYSNDRVVELMQEESALESEYMALQSDRTITWKGEEALLDDLLNDSSLDSYSYLEVLGLYYEKYNPLCCDIYIRLINIRNEIAQELGYDTYADFAYAYRFERDYTPEQVRAYLDDIATNLSSLYYTAAACNYSEEMSSEKTMELLCDVAYSFGGSFATAYDYMCAYDLYDISESSSKMPGSFMTYLPAYEMPYLYVSPTNDIGDLMTAVHEFGHFVDGYVNCNGTSSIDCNEIFSQSLEFLALDVADLTETQRSSLRKSQAADAVSVFLSQACYADFEMRLYLLDKDELIAERINETFCECFSTYLYDVTGFEDLIGPGWIDVMHFFIAPHYVISYCVSLDAALQVYQQQLADGSGLAAYETLLSLSSGNSILALLDEAGMTSPFAEGRMEELSAFLKEQMRG